MQGPMIFHGNNKDKYRLFGSPQQIAYLLGHGNITNIRPRFINTYKTADINKLIKAKQWKNLIAVIKTRRIRMHTDRPVTKISQKTGQGRHLLPRQFAVGIKSMHTKFFSS